MRGSVGHDEAMLRRARRRGRGSSDLERVALRERLRTHALGKMTGARRRPRHGRAAERPRVPTRTKQAGARPSPGPDLSAAQPPHVVLIARAHVGLQS